jgi:ABC-type tungstate transport system substrate-binding protein
LIITWYPAQVSAISEELLSSLLGEWGLLLELAGVRNLFLLSHPVTIAWAEGVLHLLQQHQQQYSRSLLQVLDPKELEIMLWVSKRGLMLVSAVCFLCSSSKVPGYRWQIRV